VGKGGVEVINEGVAVTHSDALVPVFKEDGIDA